MGDAFGLLLLALVWAAFLTTLALFRTKLFGSMSGFGTLVAVMMIGTPLVVLTLASIFFVLLEPG